VDTCSGHDDGVDTDADGVPDMCDETPTGHLTEQDENPTNANESTSSTTAQASSGSFDLTAGVTAASLVIIGLLGLLSWRRFGGAGQR